MPTTDFYVGAGDGTSTNITTPYSTAHDAATGSTSDSTAANNNVTTVVFGGSTYNITRMFLPVDTSGLSDTATITSADLVIVVGSVSGNVGTRDFALVQTSQASTSSVSPFDFDQCGAISNPTEGATRLTITTTGTKTFNLNSTGLTWVSKTGFTLLGIRSGWLDCDNVAPTDTSQEAFFQMAQSETTGTSSDPYLSVTWSEPSTTFIPKIIII